jgi:(2R)-3-sulfolactate dehydrogenase (NADP+)
VIDPKALGGDAVYSERIEALVTAMLADEGVRLPGQRRLQLLEASKKSGLKVPQPLLDTIRSLC